MFDSRRRFGAYQVLLLMLCCQSADGWIQNDASQGQYENWTSVGNDRGGMRYSRLEQINRENVHQLEAAWTYRTGEADKTIECTPLVIDGVMYITTNHLRAVALDAATGVEIWSFDPFADGVERILASGGVNRGVAWWRAAHSSWHVRRPAVFDRRANGDTRPQVWQGWR
jgi:glucose dehydrogenase